MLFVQMLLRKDSLEQSVCALLLAPPVLISDNQAWSLSAAVRKLLLPSSALLGTSPYAVWIVR